MSSPWLSILIPVYNVKPYLQDCLESILSQCDEGIEIIALDDQSTDGSWSWLQSIATGASYPIVMLQHEMNRGLSAARNTLVAHARGEYVWFLDSDDVLVGGAINQLRDIVQKNAPDLVLCDYQHWYPEDAARQKKQTRVPSFGGPARQLLTDPELLFKGLYQKGKLHAWSKISRRVLWQENLQFPEGKYFEDMVTTPRLALKVNSFYYCPQVWVKYRQRSGSILSTFSPQKIDHMLSGLDGIWKLWSEHIPDMGFRTRYFFMRYCVKVYLFAMKESQRINQAFAIGSPENSARLFEAMGGGRKELIICYLLNGDIFRLIKILRLLSA